jgi:hypothetical protein
MGKERGASPERCKKEYIIKGLSYERQICIFFWRASY